jgi:hypothetical protein
VRIAELNGDIVILACAISAGIHGALTPDHFTEGTGAGLGFAAATVLLAAFAIVLTQRPASALALAGAAAVFIGLLVSYVLAITTGVPVLHPEPESIDGLALFTKAIEVVGLFAASKALWGRVTGTLPRPIPLALTVLVALFSAVAAVAVSDGSDHAHTDDSHHAQAPLVRVVDAPPFR